MWNELRTEIHARPRMPKEHRDHYSVTLRRIYDRGANLATPEMAALWPGETTKERCEGTWKPPACAHPFENHERSQPVEAFIDFTLAEWIEKKGEVWLMPVFDDKEYVSWDFYFVVGTEEQVLEQLRCA
jgi:hypothetical protein